MDLEEFKREVAAALDSLPRRFRKELHNVTVVVEIRPTGRALREMGLDPRRDVLYGAYQGVPLPDRSIFNPPVLPDTITLYAEPLMRDFPDPGELREQIRDTVIHEIAHYLGMDDEEIEDLGY